MTVNFQRYVVTVMGKEWPSYLPYQVLEAGAVAVKQYGWYHALNGHQKVSRRGDCYDVIDTTRDQLYKPHKARIRADQRSAVNLTWGTSLIKAGRFLMTGYRRGLKRSCGHDATGFKLFARSATKCARGGHDWLSILQIYYGPRLRITVLSPRADRAGRSRVPDATRAGAAISPVARGTHAVPSATRTGGGISDGEESARRPAPGDLDGRQGIDDPEA